MIQDTGHPAPPPTRRPGCLIFAQCFTMVFDSTQKTSASSAFFALGPSTIAKYVVINVFFEKSDGSEGPKGVFSRVRAPFLHQMEHDEVQFHDFSKLCGLILGCQKKTKSTKKWRLVPKYSYVFIEMKPRFQNAKNPGQNA